MSVTKNNSPTSKPNPSTQKDSATQDPIPFTKGRIKLEISQAVNSIPNDLFIREIGTVKSVRKGIALVEGLPNIKTDELIRFQNDTYGLAFNLDPDEIGAVLLSKDANLLAGYRAYRTNRVLDVPVGDALLGRVVNALGNPIDEVGPIRTNKRLPIERPVPNLVSRDPVSKPLQTGLKVIDALIPVGRGQRELILGDRQTGKTTIALDTILNQKESNVICVYCAIGQRESSVAKFIATLHQNNAMDYCIVMVVGGMEPPGLQFIAPYAATSMAEFFMERGQDALIIYDDITRHARAYRELSLLLRRPPGREAYPGDIFYIHSRLLERSTHLNKNKGGGSLTAFPIVETHAENISAYIPTNLISITDGQIYLSPDLFQKGVLPAINVGKSVSRVGGKAQLPAYQMVSSDLRLSYSQFEELEVFSRFGTQLDQQTQQQLQRGRRIREILKQPEHQPISAAEQIFILVGITGGIFDEVDIDQIQKMIEILRGFADDELQNISGKIMAGEELNVEDRQLIEEAAKKAISIYELRQD